MAKVVMLKNTVTTLITIDLPHRGTKINIPSGAVFKVLLSSVQEADKVAFENTKWLNVKYSDAFAGSAIESFFANPAGSNDEEEALLEVAALAANVIYYPPFKDAKNIYLSGALGAQRTIGLNKDGFQGRKPYKGCKVRIFCDTSGFGVLVYNTTAVLIANIVSSGNLIATLAVGDFADFIYDGTNWKCIGIAVKA